MINEIVTVFPKDSFLEQSKKFISKYWKLFVKVFGGSGVAALIAFNVFFKGGLNTINPPEPSLNKRDIKLLGNDRWLADRSTENQQELSIRLMDLMEGGYKRSTLELLNTSDPADALMKYKQGVKEERGVKLSDRIAWWEIQKIAKEISPKLRVIAFRNYFELGVKTSQDYLTFSNVLSEAEMHHESLMVDEQALNKLDSSTPAIERIKVETSYAHSLFDNNRYIEAYALYMKLVKESKNLPQSQERDNYIGMNLTGLGMISHAEGRYSEALQYYDQEIEIWKNSGFIPNLANAYANYGRSAKRIGDDGLALAAYNAAFSSATASEHHTVALRASSAQADLYRSANLSNLQKLFLLYGRKQAKKLGMKQAEAEFLSKLARVSKLKVSQMRQINIL